MAAPSIIDVAGMDDPRDAVHRAVQAVAEGRTVVVPTETVYCLAASGLDERSVSRVMDLRGSEACEPPVLALKSADDALDYVPDFPPLAQRLARRCWPGPLTLRLADQHRDSVIWRLPPQARDAVCNEGKVELTVSINPILTAMLRLLPGPLLLWPACRSPESQPVTAQEAITAFGSQVDLVIDEGRTRFAQSSSIVEIVAGKASLVNQGVISAANLQRFASFMIAVVCTGNTCRSPMAEVLLKKRIADRLSCKIEELEDRGFLVLSAGIAASSGSRAADEAIRSMHARGLDLAMHESQPLSDRVVRYCDIILTMTRGHREAIISQWPEARERTFLVSNDRGDIADPIGGPAELYRRCADQIDGFLADWAQKLDLPSS